MYRHVKGGEKKLINVNSKLFVIPFMLIILTIIFAINIGNTYAASPDLVVNGTNAPTNVTNGQNLTVNYAVKNAGTGNISSRDEWYDSIYLSKNNTRDGSEVFLADSKHSNLSAGADYNGTFNITIPETTDGGKYYLLISTDYWDYIAESNESNNLLAVPLLINVSGPDLTVNDAKSPIIGTNGQNMTVNYTVKNVGTENTSSGNAWWDNVYLSTDDILDYSDIWLVDSSSHSNLSAGATYSDTFNITIPERISSGNYYLLIRTDAYDFLSESNGTNNVLSIPLQINVLGPDLIVTGINAPTNAINGQYITVNYTVKNVGTRNTPSGSNWQDGIYLSTDDILDSSDTFLDESYYFDLNAGATYNGTFDITIPEGLSSRQYYLLISTNLYGNLAESNATNNILALLINVSGPDLAVNSTNVSVTATNGQDISVDYTVKNNGTADTPSGYKWYDEIYLSDDDQLDDSDSYLGYLEHSDLSTGADYTDTFNITIPKDSGNYYLLIKTDNDENIAESDETNNIWVIPLLVNVSGPDLVVNSTNVSVTATNGQDISVDYTVKNNGTADTPSGYGWYDKIYLSDDDQLDDSDSELGELSHSDLIAGLDYTDTFNIIIPGETSGGNHYLLIKTDSDDSLLESNGDNNVLVIPLLVNFLYPDLVLNSTNASVAATNGQNLSISYTVKNNGTGNTSFGYGWCDTIYLSDDDQLDDSDELIELYHSDLNAGDSYTDTFNITIPGKISSGNYYLLIKTDAYGYIAESDETNNVLVIPLSINILNSNLAVNSTNTSVTATNGQNLNISYTVKNDGTENTPAGFGWRDYMYLSDDDQFDGSDSYLGYLEHSDLNAGDSYTDTFNITLPIKKSGGNYYLLIITDDYDSLSESNESDNLLVIPLLVNFVNPDLVVNSTNASVTATNGQNLSISYTVKNNGTENTPPGFGWYDEIYLSDDGQLDAYDSYLGYLEHSDLSTGADYTDTFNITIPEKISGGNYYLLIKTDINDDITELNEINNMLVIPLLVNVSGPDLIVNSTNAPSTANNGQNISLNYTVKNNGTENTPTGSGWYDRIYLSKDNLLDYSDYYLGELGHSDLNAGDSYTKTFNITIPGHITDGNYYLLITTAVWNWITESNGSNNIMASPLHIQAAPTVADVDPANNSKINNTSKVITVTFNEPVLAGSAYDTITVTGPSGAINVAKNINGKVLTLTPTSNYVNGDYTVNMPINAVTDLEGAALATSLVLNFTVDTVPPTVSATPVTAVSNSSINISLSTEPGAAIYYRINGGLKSAFIGSGTVLISNVGTNTLEFYGVDAAGNPSTHTTYSYTIDKTAPAVTANKTSGLSNRTIYVSLSSEPNAVIYYRINSGSWSAFTGSGIVSIANVGTNNLEFYAVDAAGNPSAHTTYSYTIDKTAPKVTSTYPKRYATGVSRTKTIYLKFSEKIKASSYWSKIVVKDKYGHAVKISKSISGNIIYIKTSKRSSYSYYTVYIPKAAVKDYAGNNLAAGYTFKFKTGRY